jgi:ribosomal protein S1
MSKAQQQGGELEANAAVDRVESAVLNDGTAVPKEQAPKKTTAKKTAAVSDAEKSAATVKTAEKAAVSAGADGSDAEKKAEEAAKKAEAAAKKAAAAEKKAEAAEKKVLEAEKKVAEAEKKAEEAERKAAEAEKKTDISEIKLKIAAEKAAAAEKAEKAAAEKAAAEKAITEKAAAEKAAAEKAITEKAVTEKTAADKAEAEKAITENSVKTAAENAETVKETETVKTVAETPKTAAAPVREPKKPEPAPAKKPLYMKRRSPDHDEKITMEDVMSSKNSNFVYKAGKKVSATVIIVKESGVDVAIGGKKDGFIDKSEMNIDGSYDPSLYKEGDVIDAVIIENPNKGSTYINLSKKQVDQIRENDRICEEILKGQEFELVCDKVVKGGITGRYGAYTVFVPASQIKFGFVKNLEEYLGKKLRLKALPPKEKFAAENAAAESADETAEINAEISENESMADAEASGNRNARPRRKTGKFIVASQRIVLEREQREKEDEFWNSIFVGDIVTGKVKRFAAFGAFVNVRGFDCLVHISDISWNRIVDPSKVLELNALYDFVVLNLDRGANKISLGYKQLQRKPYEMAYEKFPVGSVVTGKVERIKDFGAFISLDDGVDGLVHVSQISHNYVRNANEVLKVGDEITAKVLSFDENKITLSIKELLDKPEAPEEVYEDYGEGSLESRENKFKKREAGKREFKSDAPFEPRGNGSNAAKPNRERTPRKPENAEASEWVATTSATTSLGDLFKNIKLDVEE